MRIKKSNCFENEVLPEKSTSLKPGSRPQAFPTLHSGSSLNLSTGKIFNAQPLLAFKSSERKKSSINVTRGKKI
jgi:hypothetical protein